MFFVLRPSAKPATLGNEYTPGFCNRAEGMSFAGQPQNSACKQLDISRTQIYQWLKRAKVGDYLVNKPGRDPEPSLHPVAKRVIAMAANKRHQSTQKLIHRPTRTGYITSNSLVHRYLREKYNCGLLSCKKAEIDQNVAHAPP